jgi:hypothetical protein
MRRMLIATAASLLAFTGSAWADGPVIRWDGLAGIMGSGSNINGNVGDIAPSGPAEVAIGGRVMLNLKTGFIAINVEGLSFARQFAAQHVLGSPIDEPKTGTIVCASWSQPFPVDTEEFAVTDGNGSYRGFVDPASLELCGAYPAETVFLLRNLPNQGGPNRYVAFGIGRTIQSP